MCCECAVSSPSVWTCDSLTEVPPFQLAFFLFFFCALHISGVGVTKGHQAQLCVLF